MNLILYFAQTELQLFFAGLYTFGLVMLCLVVVGVPLMALDLMLRAAAKGE